MSLYALFERQKLPAIFFAGGGHARQVFASTCWVWVAGDCSKHSPARMLSSPAPGPANTLLPGDAVVPTSSAFALLTSKTMPTSLPNIVVPRMRQVAFPV